MDLFHFFQGIKWWAWCRLTREGRGMRQFLRKNNIPDGYAELLAWERGEEKK